MPMPVMPPRLAWLRGRPSGTCRPASTVPFESSAGAVDPRSWSCELSEDQLLGAKYCVRARPGDSSQDRVAEVVGSRRRPVPRGRPRCCPPRRPRARRRPSTRPRRCRSAPPGSSPASRRPRAPRRPSRCRSSSPRRCRRSRRPRCRCSRFNPVRCRIAAVGWPGRIDGLVEHRRARVHVQSHQDVGRRAPAQLVGDGEDLAAGDVDDRGAGDADRRADVAAGQVARGYRGPDVGGPQDGAGVGGQRVDRVVLRRHVDAPGGLERLAVDLAVEHRRRPGRGRPARR